MKIGVDIRSLLEEYRSGVGEYTYKVLKRILETDRQNPRLAEDSPRWSSGEAGGESRREFNLFYNIRHSVKTEPPKFDYPNIKTFGYRYPNRWLNLSLRFLGWPKLEKLSGQPDIFWFPNFGFMNFNMKVPYVLTVHDLSFERYPEFFTPMHRAWHKLINCKKMARGAAKIIAVSENTKRDLVELYGVEPDRIEVVYEGINAKLCEKCETTRPTSPACPKCFAYRSRRASELAGGRAKMRKVAEKYGLPDKFILFLGTIEPRKNIEAIIRAFDKYANEYANECESGCEYHLVLAGGPGWRNEEIYRVYEQAKNKDKIKFIGYVDKEDKPVLYRLASLFVFPSIYEGFGLPPLEAMACGTPVITSNVSSLPEVVGDAGLLVDPYNICELAEAMRGILTDNRLREDFIKKGLERIKKFSWDKCARETSRILHELIHE